MAKKTSIIGELGKIDAEMAKRSTGEKHNFSKSELYCTIPSIAMGIFASGLDAAEMPFPKLCCASIILAVSCLSVGGHTVGYRVVNAGNLKLQSMKEKAQHAFKNLRTNLAGKIKHAKIKANKNKKRGNFSNDVPLYVNRGDGKPYELKKGKNGKLVKIPISLEEFYTIR